MCKKKLARFSVKNNESLDIKLQRINKVNKFTLYQMIKV